MRFRQQLRNALARAPIIEGLFRRFVWSRVHYTEAELRLLDALPARSFDVAIDVGAAQGEYAWVLARKARRVFAFEPGRQFGDYLKPLTFASPITLVRAAVGDAPGVVRLYTPAGSGKLYSEELAWATVSTDNAVVQSRSPVVQEVPQLTLDGFVADQALEDRSVDLIKIDVEGYENEVLAGARAVIERYRPIIICEIEQRHSPDPLRVFRTLEAAGYACFAIRGGVLAPFDPASIAKVQDTSGFSDALVGRSGNGVDPYANYVNNFIFQHPRSRVRIAVANGA
jgi:FkbM family methyltransferase